MSAPPKRRSIVDRVRPDGMLDAFIDEAWHELRRRDTTPIEAFDPSTLDGLPAPARRLLSSALPRGTPLQRAVRLDMTGTLKIGPRWFPFHAEQIVRAGVGFVWRPIVGSRWFRFVGADVLCPDRARTEFRLFGRFPVVSATGPEVQRSGHGRHVAETAAWLPQALTPQAGARWTPIDDDRALVVLPDSDDHPVEVDVDPRGRLREIRLDRWNAATKPPTRDAFGGRIDAVEAHDGVQVASRGVVGWKWGGPQQADGVFFTYDVTSAAFID